MSAPAEPDTDHTSTPSADGDRDQTAVAAGASGVEGSSTDPSFGPPAAAGEVGSLGPYRIVKELGKGGMGAVYAAVDTRLERRLALKVMLTQFAANTSAKERFLREAKAAAKVSHDNVVVVYEADERNGISYIAMQFLEGYPLDQYLRKKGVPTVPQVLRIAAETAAGLAAAHKIGLIHRDIKPANLWLEAPHGRVKVLDFGLAKPVDTESELTRSGMVVGTPAYMSPEQARGEKVDHRTDLFSLGSVLYRLCTGKLPFTGPTTMAVLMSLGMDEPASVRELNPDVPESLAALIHQLLSKRADARPQSAAEVVTRLHVIADQLTAPRAHSAEQSTSLPQVVYVPIQVTAVPEANPFADLDATNTELDSADPSGDPPPAPAPVRAKSGGRWLWPAVGLAALVALAAGGLVIALKNKDRTETKSDGPDGTTGTGKDGKAPAPKSTPVTANPDRKAAEYVLSLNGTVRLSGGDREIKAVGDLPRERFNLSFVSLSDPAVTDGELTRFKDCRGLTSLELRNTPVTDAGLAHLKELKGLTYLVLNNTKVTDAGLKHLKELKGLTSLGLGATPVTDAGLEHLKGLKGLTYLDLTKTKVAGAGLVHLKDLPELTSLSLSGTPVTDAGLAHLTELKGLTELNLYGSTQLTDAGLVHLKELKGLRLLNLSFTSVTGAGLEHLKELKGLATLGLKHTPVTDAGLVHLKELKGLARLDLNGTAVTDVGLAHLKELKALTALDLRGTKVTAKGLEEFHSAVPGCRIEHDGGVIEPVDVDRKAAEWVIAQGGTVRINGDGREIKAVGDLPRERFTLSSVSLPNTAVTDTGLEHLKELKGLVALDLNGTKVTDLGLAHLRELKALTSLNLYNTSVTDAGLTQLKELKGLTALELRATKVTGAELAQLKELKALTSLSLTETPVTDAGLEHLKELKALTRLSLYDTKVTDTGLEHLKECKWLLALDVRRTKVSAKGLEAFHAAAPGCKIEHDGGVIEPKK
jgi:serine/threonine protein kinase/Leucine-rich repeat (LRR) protein